MSDKIKKLLLKKHAFSIVLLLIVGCTGLFMNRNEISYYRRGAVEYRDQDLKKLTGRYVEYDLKDIKLVECFMVRTQKKLLSDEKNYYYYLAAFRENSNIHFFILMAPEEDKEILDSHVEAFHKNKTGDSYKFVGKCVKQDEYLQSKLISEVDMFDNNRYGSTYVEQCYIAQVEPPVFMIPVNLVYILCITYAIIRLFLILFSGAGSGEQMKEMERDYEYSRFFTDKIRIGDAYMYFFQKNKNIVLNNSRIMWMYECSTDKSGTGIKTDEYYNGIEIWDDEYNSYQIENIDKKTVDDILNYAVRTFPHILIGYSEKLDKMYIYQNEQFKDIVYNMNGSRERDL